MGSKVTIYDVANAAHVSMATVSRVMNGNNKVKQKTRDKVLKVIEELNYHPNAVAQGLARRKTTTIGLIIPDLTNVYFNNLAVGIYDIALMYNYNIIICNTDEDDLQEKDTIDNLLAKQIDGIIYLGNDPSDYFKEVTNKNSVATVLAGTVDDNGTPSVNINYHDAIMAATNFFIEQNKKPVLVLTDRKYPINKDYQIPGFKDAFKANNLALEDALIYEVKDNDLAEETFNKIYKSDANAAIIIKDEIAIQMLNKGFELGLNIPKDFQIISTNNTVITKYARPMLSSISQPIYDIGAIAMRILTKLMNDEEVMMPQVYLDYKIIHRGTTITDHEQK